MEHRAKRVPEGGARRRVEEWSEAEVRKAHTRGTPGSKKMGQMTMHAPQKKKKNLTHLETLPYNPAHAERIHDVPYKFVEEDCKENAKDSPAEYFYKKERH